MDIDTLSVLIGMVEDTTPQYDYRLNQLIEVIRKKEENPINPGNRKMLIFTAFADAAEYLYKNIAPSAKKLGLNAVFVIGSVEGRMTIPGFKVEVNHVPTCFSPVSKNRNIPYLQDKHSDIDILIGTDCISEGQNLRDCDYCINYDTHWNLVKIIQRFGRTDRIGSKDKVIQLVNFWPDLTLDEHINLKARVEARMRTSVMISTGDDDLINQDGKGDLEHRKEQLKKLREEVIDLENVNFGISIADLGLNDLRVDSPAHMKDHGDIDHIPFGIHVVVRGEKPGVIFALKNVDQKINIKNQNRSHPFYMVCVGNDGEIITNHLQPKGTLDEMRHIARGKTEPDKDLCRVFNKKTKDGRGMGSVSKLLEDVTGSIIGAKDEEDIDSFFPSGGTIFTSGGFSGPEDFEFIYFMVVMQMINFPENTRVGKRLLEEAFYKHLPLTPVLKARFMSDIDRIAIENSPTKSNLNPIKEAETKEVMLLLITLERQDFDGEIVEAIAGQNPHKPTFLFYYEDSRQLAIYHGKPYRTNWIPEDKARLSLSGNNLDAIQDGPLQQVAVHSEAALGQKGKIIDDRLKMQDEIDRLSKLIRKTETAAWKEQQFKKRFELYTRLQEYEKQLEEIING